MPCVCGVPSMAMGTKTCEQGEVCSVSAGICSTSTPSPTLTPSCSDGDIVSVPCVCGVPSMAMGAKTCEQGEVCSVSSGTCSTSTPSPTLTPSCIDGEIVSMRSLQCVLRYLL